jgi:hypothetical protein
MKSSWLGPVAFIVLWLGFQAVGERFLYDPGTFWHIATGEKILHEGFIAHDPYTFTFAGTPWIPYQWLGEVGMALVHRVGGFDGVLVIATALAAGLFAWLGVRLVRIGLHPIFAFGLLLLALASTANHFHARPLLLTMIAMAWTMDRLIAFESGRIGLNSLSWLVPMFAVWSNIHGGMLGGLGTLGFAIAGWKVYRFLGWPSPIDGVRTLLGLSLIFILCGLTAFASPYGADLPRTWMLIMNMPKLPELIVEHTRFTFTDPRGWPMLVFAGLYLFCLCGVRHKPRVVWLLPLVWLAQAMLRVRHGSLFTIVGMVALIDLWPQTRWAQWLAVKRPDVFSPAVGERRTACGIALTALICVGIALIVQAAGLRVPLIGVGSAKLDPKAWPVELLDTIREHEPKSAGQPARIFNDYTDGGFLIYFAPRYKVFVDDRCEVFGDDWLEEFVRAGESSEATTAAMERWQKQYGEFDFALTRTDTEFDKYLAAHPQEWVLAKPGTIANFYTRRRP